MVHGFFRVRAARSRARPCGSAHSRCSFASASSPWRGIEAKQLKCNDFVMAKAAREGGLSIGNPNVAERIRIEVVKMLVAQLWPDPGVMSRVSCRMLIVAVAALVAACASPAPDPEVRLVLAGQALIKKCRTG